MKRILLALMAAVMLLSFVGCTEEKKNGGSATSSGVKTENIVLVTDDGEEFSLIPYDVEEFLKAAEVSYANNPTESIAYYYIKRNMNALPVTVEWKYAGSYKPSGVKVLISETKDMKNAVEYAVDVKDTKLDIVNLKTEHTYYWRVKATSDKGELTTEIRSVKTVASPRIIMLSGLSTNNVRDLGGWKDADGNAIIQGLAYRGRALGGLSAEGVVAAKALGIKTVLDLRNEHEYTDTDYVDGVGKLGEDVKIVKNPASAYASFLTAPSATPELKLFADWANYPIYFHCAAGADRTGTLAFVLEGLCGIKDEYLIADYELTGNRPLTYEGFPEFLQKISGFEGATTREKLYNHCLTKMGLTHMELSNIYNILMTESAVFDSNSLSAGKADGNTTSFDLVLRSSGGVASVKVGGTDVGWSMKGNTLVVNSATKGAIGVITFKDGATLNFSI